MQYKQIYFDNNATTWLDPRVSTAMQEIDGRGLANPASQHRAGRLSLSILEEAKEAILHGLGAPTSGVRAAQIILTSGGTEANNLALHAFSQLRSGLVIVGTMEHPSLLLAAELSALCLNPIRPLPALPTGQYDLNQLSNWLSEIYSGPNQQNRVALVSLMLANNETGVINNIAEVVKLCQPYEIPVHCDIVQAAGKIEFDMAALGLTAVTVNAHKCHGPVGVGALIVNAPLEPRPLVVGGGQQLGWRAGTEPVVLAVGLAKTIQVAAQERHSGAYRQVASLRDAFEARIIRELDCVSINGQQDLRLPQTSNLSFEGLDRQALQMALDLEGLACSAGAACSSGSARPSATLLAMGLSDERVASALRFSLSRSTTASEVDSAAEIVVRVVNKLRKI